MNSVYENLKALIGTPEYPGTKKIYEDKLLALRLVHHIGGPIEFYNHSWRDNQGTLFATVTPDNVVQLHVLEVSQRVKTMMGKYGLGQIVKSKKVAAAHEYWINSLNYRFTVGMKIDLTTNTPVGATTVDSIVIDPKLRLALMKEIKSKAIVGSMFLRLSDAPIPNNKIEILRRKTAADFYEAVQKNDTELISLIPFYGAGRWWRAKPTYDKYPDRLKAYINTNRAALYEAAGVSA